jgi:hypothetical protein
MAWPAGVDARRWLLKVDTQGHELPVLQGGTRTLDRCVGVQLELSLLPLRGQALYIELIAWLEARGFDSGTCCRLCRPAQGRMLQMDGLLFRRDAHRAGGGARRLRRASRSSRPLPAPMSRRTWTAPRRACPRATWAPRSPAC